MNKKPILFLIIFALLSVVFMNSCMSGESSREALLAGIWENSGTDNIHIEFKDDGTARMAGGDVNIAGESAEFTWAADANNIEINDMFLLYSGLFVYDLSADGDSLDLYMVAAGLMNSDYDDMMPGNLYTFTRSSETDLDDIEDSSSSSYSYF